MLSVRIIGSSGREGKSENQFAQPRGICIDPRTKEIYVVDCNNHRIQVYHLHSLAFIRQIGGKTVFGSSLSSLNYAVGICMDDSKQIFVADTNNHRIVVFNHFTGIHVRNIGSQGALAGYLNSPYGVCVNKASGLLYVADYDNNRVQVFNKETGEYERSIGSGAGTAEGQMNQPIAVCIDDEKSVLLVADYSNNRVQLFEGPSGVFIRCIGGEGTADGFSGPRGLCICKEANLLFVSDRENHRIKVFDNTTYALIRHLGQGMSPGQALGEFNRPMEMCVSVEDGVLLVVDGYNHRVQILELPELRKAQIKLRQSLASCQYSSIEDSANTSGSKLAASLEIATEGLVVQDVNTADLKLVFPSLGGMFNILFNKEDLHVLHDLLGSSSRVGLYDQLEKRPSTTSDEYNSDPMLIRQSEIFLSILDEVAQQLSQESQKQNSPAKSGVNMKSVSLFDLVTPSLFALKALLDQRWSLHTISSPVVTLLVYYLSSLDSENTNDHSGLSSVDKERATIAVVAMLKKVVASDRGLAKIVLSSTLESLTLRNKSQTLTKFSDNSTAVGSTLSFTGPVAMAYFDIMATVVADTGFKSAFYQPSAFDKARKSDDLNHSSSWIGEISIKKDVTSIIFGTEYATKLSQTLFQNSKSTSLSSSSNVETKEKINVDLPVLFPELLKLAFKVKDLRNLPVLQSWDSVEFYPPVLFDLQMEFFTIAKDYFSGLLSSEAANLRPTESKRQSRGGRNIWRKEDQLAVGDLVDCMDKEKCWFESMVHEVFPDNCVKIHFLGWGSKWDDIIYPAELETRIAPLNSQTKNWRSELYEGGLIEIKCNDDLVNQKWMWGKITALHLPEEWVEVSYSFSNEPIVVKRAWLHGETICPVGMHTKDKSKAAAAALTKPLKKVEDILKEKNMETLDPNETVFVSEDFNYFGSFEPPIAHGISDTSSTALTTTTTSRSTATKVDSTAGGGGGCSSVDHNSSDRSSSEHSPMDSISTISFFIFESLMQEVLSVVSESIEREESVSSDHFDQHRKRQSLASAIIQMFASSPFKRLLAPYFTKILTFQCGVKVKTLSHGYLVTKSRASNEFLLSIDFQPIVDLLNRFKSICERYCSVLVHSLSGMVSPPAIKAIVARIQTTVDICGVSEVANELMALLLTKDEMRRRIFDHFFQPVNNDRFRSSPTNQVRKMLSFIFKSASRKNVEQFQVVLEEYIQSCIIAKLNLDSFKEGTSISGTRALMLMTTLVESFDKVKSVCLLEMSGTNLSQNAAERAWKSFFSSFDSDSVKSISIAFAVGINTLFESLSKSFNAPNIDLSLLDATARIFQVIASEEMTYIFQYYSRVLLSYRLIQRNQGLLPAEQSILKLLSLPSMETMIYDTRQAPIYTSRFQKHVLERIDDDCCDITEDIFSLVVKNNGFNVKVITAGAWPCTVSSIPYGMMTMPKQLQLIQSEFECFYRVHHSKDGSRLNTGSTTSDGLDVFSLTTNERKGSRRLHWCYGLGSVTLNCYLRGKVAISVDVNEPQAALLLLFNKISRPSLFVKEICRDLNLPLEVVSCILKSLCEHTHKLIAVISTTLSDISNGTTQMNDRVVLDNSLLCSATSSEPIDMTSGYFGQHCQHSAHAVKDFRREVIDATIVRILKSAVREKTDFVYVASENGVMTRKSGFHSDILVERVIKRLVEQNTQFFVPISEILARCDYLSDINYIFKVSCNIDDDPQVLGVGYCYHLEVDSKENVESQPSTPSLLQSNKPQVQLPLTGDKLFNRMCAVLNIQEDETKAEENSFYESKDSAYITSNHFLKSFVEWISNSPMRVQSQEEIMSPYSNSDDQTEFHFGVCNTSDGAALPMMANKSYAQFHSLLHRLYNSYAIMVDQLNKLLHQHSLGVQDVSIPGNGNGTIYLPPTSLSRYMTFIEDKFFSEFTEKLHFDHLDIHQNVFCSLPRDLLKVVMQSFIRILKQSTVQRKIGEAAHHKDGVEENAKRLALEEAASLVDKAERDGFEKPQLSELWGVEFEVNISALQEEDTGPLTARFFNFLSLYTHEVSRSHLFRSNVSVDAAASGVILFSLRIFVLACCHCLPVDKDVSVSGSNLFAGLSNSTNPKNTSAAHRGKYSSKVEKRKNKTPSKRGNDGSNSSPSSSLSHTMPVPKLNSAGFQTGSMMAMSGWQSAFAFNPPSNLESCGSIDSKCDNGSTATMGTISSIIDEYSPFGPIPFLQKQSSGLCKEQVSGDSSPRFLPPLPIDMSQNQQFFDIDDLKFHNPFLNSTIMRSRSNSDVMGAFFKSVSSDTRADFMVPECSLTQLLQIYHYGFIQHMRTLFQVPESAATSTEKVGFSSAYISESLFSWFDKLSIKLHEEYPDIQKELFWMHQSPRFDLSTMFSHAYTILDSNQDKQLTEDDFCSAEGDSGVVNPVENTVKVGLNTSGSCGIKNIQGDRDKWKLSKSNMDYLSTLQLNDLYSDRSKGAWSISLGTLLSNAQLIVSAPYERLLHWLAQADWDITLFSEKLLSAATLKPSSQSFFSITGYSSPEQSTFSKEKGSKPLKRSKCNSCDKFCEFPQMCSLSCGHFFCKACWISAILKEDECSSRTTSLSCLLNTCVHDEMEPSTNQRRGLTTTNTCPCIVESDFVSFLLGDEVGAAFQQKMYHRAEVLFASRKGYSCPIAPEFSTFCRVHDNYRVTFRLLDDYSLVDGRDKHFNSFANRAYFLLPDVESFAVFKVGEYLKSVLVAQDPSQYWHLRQLIDGWNLVIVAIKLISTSVQSLIQRFTSEVVNHMNRLLEETININSLLKSSKPEQLSIAVAISKFRRLVTRSYDNISRFYRALHMRPLDSLHEHEYSPPQTVEFGDITYDAVNIIPSHVKRRCGAAYYLCRDLVRSLEEWVGSSKSSCTNDFTAAVHLLTRAAHLVSDGQAKNLIKAGLPAVLVVIMRSCQRSAIMCLHVCQVMNKLCSISGSTSNAFLKVLTACEIWATLCNIVGNHLDDVDTVRSCYRVMVSVLEYMEGHEQSLINEQIAANCRSLQISLHRGLQAFKQNEVITVQILKVVSVLLEKSSSCINEVFITERTYELMLECMRKHFSVDGMKMMFTLSVGRIASASKLMQERLKDLQIFDTLIEIVNEDPAQYSTLKAAFWALGCLVQFYPMGQNKLAAVLGACGAYCTALQRVMDLPTISVILTSLSIISAENEFVKQALMEENVLQVLLEKKDHLKTLFLNSHSAAQKNLLKKLFVTCDAVMDSFGHKSHNYSLEENNEMNFIIDS